jgi:Domain of unknown function (DUF5666)
MSSNPLRSFVRHPVQSALTALFVTVLAAGCGGGGSDAGSSGTTATAQSAFSSGPITGFGSVILRGVRFDDSQAKVSDDDGAEHRNDELKLGMMAEIESAGITSDATGSHAKASGIRFGSEIVGPVSAVAADGKSLVVLGETVQITTTTIFDDRLAGGIAAVVAGTTVIEVHGMLDVATGTYTATRIEAKAAATFYKLRGVVTAIDKTAHTFRIGNGSDEISYDTIKGAVPAALDNGLLVRVKLQTSKVGGRWVATHLISAVKKVEDHDEAEVEGTITASTFAVDKKFSVNGIAVDATNASFPKGTTGIVLGARVEVHGRALAGTIIASRVSIESEQEREAQGFELHGAISALDAAAKTFMLRTLKVSYAGGNVEFRKGTAGDLANGRQVEVKGARSADGTTLVATRIGFEN